MTAARLPMIPLLLLAQSLLVQPARAGADDTARPGRSASRLTEQAIEAGLTGADSLRETLLRRAIDVDPDYAPARWAAGEVLHDDVWMPVGLAQSTAAEDDDVADYYQLRAASGDSPDEHLRLARWCRRRGLDGHARYHWLAVLRADPNHREALGSLDLVWRDGRLLTSEEARNLPAEQRRSERAAASWSRRIARWEKTRAPTLADREDPTLNEIRETLDEDAIGPFESLVARLADDGHRRFDRRLRLAEAFVAAMADTPTYAATASLVRVAVVAPVDSLREQAAYALTSRPKHESVPLLLAGLKAPIESESDIRIDRNGSVTYSHEVYQEGAEADRALERSHVGRVDLRGLRSLGTRDRMVNAMYRSQFETLRYAMAFQAEAERFEAELAEQNAEIESINERVVPVLTAATGQSFGNDPRRWWDYWAQYDGYEVPDYRPVDREYEQSESTRDYVPEPPRRHECFVAGTPVWTDRGRVAIEQLREGDLVLAKDTATGELSFRPVLGTTLREPSGLIEIAAGETRVRATTGHPFWVAGHGWKMAKELSPGDRLTTVEGPVAIDSVGPAGEAEAHNLIVEGLANYFVGEAGLLSHDNTKRRPERVRVARR